ncbi:sensor histidine kinase [Paraclostridium bifermentans]|uniref:sensor histidine kinase n=1 Tax=Paraclostridium bifermentans TaxID=1490 RepID=UPI00359C347E
MSEKVFLSSFYISAILASSFIVYIILAKVFNVKLVELFLDVSYKRIIGLIISRFIQFMIVCIFLNNINFIKYAKYKTLYVVGFILFLNHIIIFVIERYLIKNLHKINMYIIVIAISIGIIQILLVDILNIFSKEMEENFILKMNLNRKIYDEEIIDMYKKMTGWKHDFRNHINMILGLVEANSKDDVISYINEIDIGIRELDKNIYTDNIAINSILVSKIKVAKYKNIKVNLDIKINSEIKISNVDICIILGNLLDNSIEACSVIEGYKFIDLRIISENNRLVIKISNNTNGYVNEINGKFLTTKNNEINGIGLIQIDSIVKKHNGYINRKHENNIFMTYAMIQYED